MAKDWKRYTITAALPYANGGIHLGHLAGAYLPADIYARYRRLKGDDILFICGSDEHGVPITLGARKEGITPQQFVDKYHQLMKDSFEKFGISFDIYSRTSNKIHHETAQQFFLDLYNKGVFTEETSLQYYDEQEKMFLADRYIMGTCPFCGYEKAYGDQCESCGSSLSPKDLINPVSVLSGKPPVTKETKHWYLPLNKYESWLREWILEGHKKDWKPNVYGQCKSWLDGGLQPRAMTRDLNWGVKVPLPGAEGKVLYVWFDAPIGYISATKELRPDGWDKYWKDENTRLIHFIGKDNIVFHCIIFPAILKAHGDYILPDNVPANEFLNLEGEKLSTSRNWAVWLHDYLVDFPNCQDVLRYVLTSTAPETKDNDFTWKDFQSRNNSELASIYGNMVNRTMVLTHKFFNGTVPSMKDNLTDAEERELIYQISLTKKNVEESMEQFRFREALSEAMNLVRAGNKYLSDREPWKLINTDKEKTGHILNICLQLIANISLLMKPFLPDSSKKVFNMIGVEEGKLSWEQIGKTNFVEQGVTLNAPEILFRKIENEEIQKQVDKLHANKKNTVTTAKEQPPPMNEITYDDFTKIQLLTGTIEAAEKVKNADKLLQLRVNLGTETRTIVSGIAASYAPENIIGQQVCVVANLASRKIKGIESKGMILMAEDENGKLKFVTLSEAVKPGSIVS